MTRTPRSAPLLLCIALILLTTVVTSAAPDTVVARTSPPPARAQTVAKLPAPLSITAADSDSGGPVGTAFVIADMAADVARPAVAYNTQDQEYLVVWQTQGSTNPGNIWSTRVARDGRHLGNYQVEAGGGAIRSNPDVVYNPEYNDYYVVWQHEVSGRAGIRGKHFTPGGTVYNSLEISLGPELANCTEPAIAYASNPTPTDERFVVVWERHVDSNLSSDIEGQVLTNGGGYAGSNFLVDAGTTTRSYSQPDIAYNLSRNEYLVVYTWHDKVGPNYDVLGRILSRSGGVLSDPAYLIGYQTVDEWAPAVAALPTVANYGGYVVAWEVRYAANDGDIYARHVPGRMAADPSEVLGDVQVVSELNREQVAPAIAANQSNHHYLVSWAEQREAPFDSNTAVRGRELAEDATVWGAYQWQGGAFSGDVAVAAGPVGGFLTAWTETGLFAATDIFGRLWGRRVYVPLVLRNP